MISFNTNVHYAEEYFETMLFSAGELHTKCVNAIRNGEDDHHVNVVNMRADISSPKDLLELLMAKEIIDRHFSRHVTKTLTIPYLPYSRQDRVTEPGTAFSLKILAKMLNSLEFDRITTWDCHSDVGVGLINNCVNVPQHEFVKRLFDKYRPDVTTLIAPDAGAAKKVAKAGELLGLPVAIATKNRDVPTGEVINMQFSQKIAGHVLIVDDIIDGGWTFTKIAPLLRDAGASLVSLFTTHGIYSKGLWPLAEAGIPAARIYCANTVGSTGNMQLSAINKV